MERSPEYITKVEVKGLLHNFNIIWSLNRHINILSGINGSGKSTVIKNLASVLLNKKNIGEEKRVIDSIAIEFDNGARITANQQTGDVAYSIDVISTFDVTLRSLRLCRNYQMARSEPIWTGISISCSVNSSRSKSSRERCCSICCKEMSSKVKSIRWWP